MSNVVKGIGRAVGGAVKGLKKIKPLKLLGKAAPIAAMFVPGLGPAAMAAVGAGSSLLRGEGLGGAVRGGVLGGLGAGRGGPLSFARNALMRGGGGGLPPGLQAFGGGGAASGEQPSGGRGILGGVWDYIRNNPMQAAQIGLGGYSAIQGARREHAANAAVNRALEGVAAAPTSMDLSGEFSDPSNPFARSTRAKGGALSAANRALAGGY